MQDYVTNIDERDGSVACNIFLITFLYMAGVTPVPELTLMMPRFSRLINENIITSDIIDKY